MKRNKWGFYAVLSITFILLSLAVLTGCGGGGGGGGTSPEPTDEPEFYTGYVFINTNALAAQSGENLVVLTVSDAPDGCSPLEGATVYQEDSPDNSTVTQSDGSFKLTKKKTRNQNGAMGIVVVPPSGQQGASPVNLTLYPASGTDNISQLTICPASGILMKGKIVQLQAKALLNDGSYVSIKPELASWSLDNSKAASVSSKGVLEALDVGSVNVTVSCKDFTSTGNFRIAASGTSYGVSGKITSSGSPVKGAVVGIVGLDRVAVTDSAGNYALSDLPSSLDLTLFVSSLGKVRYTAPLYLDSDKTVNVDLSNYPGSYGKMWGQIIDSSGKPVEGVTVSIGRFASKSDSSGLYSISDIPAGAYAAVFSKQGYAEQYCSVIIEADKGLNYNLRMQSSGSTEFGTIRGRIVNSSGAGVSDAAISYKALTSAVSQGAVTSDKDGFFTFLYVEPGTYQLTASKSGYTIDKPVSCQVTSGGEALVRLKMLILDTIKVEPLLSTIPKLTTQQFTATGVYKGRRGSVRGISVDWFSSDKSVATIDSTGLATGKGKGVATITAVDTETGKRATSTLTVTDAVLESIAVTPADSSVAKGSTLQLKATGTYADSSTKDITNLVTWSSGDTDAVTVNTTGLSTGKNVGGTTITATDPNTSIKGSTTVTVTNAELVSIAVTPADSTMTQWQNGQFTAMGTYTDESTQNITDTVTWTSSDDSALSISNAGGSKGETSALAVGNVTVTATDSTTGISGSTGVTVSACINYVFDRFLGDYDIRALYAPTSIAFDSSGNVYITDNDKYVVQKYSSDGTYIKRWGGYGSGDNQFLRPQGIAIDSSDNVYVVDSSQYMVKKFDSDGTFIASWGSKGSEEGQFENPLGISTDSSDNVYVADSYNHRIQKFDKDGNFLTTIGSQGTEEGQFSNPACVAVDSTGNLFVADTGNDRIQKFDSNGTFLLAWGTEGTSSGQFRSPNSIAFDSSGNVYVTDSNNRRVQKFDSNGSFITYFGSSGSEDGQFLGIRDVGIDSSDNIYVCDASNHRVSRFDSSKSYLDSWGNIIPYNQYKKITVDLSGNVYVTDIKNDQFVIFDSSGNYVNGYGSHGTGAEEFSSPNGIAVDSSGYIYVADSQNNRIKKYDSYGNVLAILSTFDSGYKQFIVPTGIAFDPDGNFFVSDGGNCRIVKFDSSMNYIKTFGSRGTNPDQFKNIIDIATDSEGCVYVADSQLMKIKKFDNDGNLIAYWGTEGTEEGQFYRMSTIAVDSSGYVYVPDYGLERIQKFDSSGNFIASFGSKGPEEGQFNIIWGVAVDKNGNIYSGEFTNYRIQMFKPAP